MFTIQKSVSKQAVIFDLPAVLAITTGLPVIIWEWILAFSVQSLGIFFGTVALFIIISGYLFNFIL